jgi:hypothetical protein
MTNEAGVAAAVADAATDENANVPRAPTCAPMRKAASRRQRKKSALQISANPYRRLLCGVDDSANFRD